jgi:hypothetical protein
LSIGKQRSNAEIEADLKAHGLDVDGLKRVGIDWMDTWYQFAGGVARTSLLAPIEVWNALLATIEKQDGLLTYALECIHDLQAILSEVTDTERLPDDDRHLFARFKESLELAHQIDRRLVKNSPALLGQSPPQGMVPVGTLERFQKWLKHKEELETNEAGFYVRNHNHIEGTRSSGRAYGYASASGYLEGIITAALKEATPPSLSNPQTPNASNPTTGKS